MSNENPHDDFETRTRSLLRDSSDALDGHTRSRLARARAAAVAAAGSGRRDWRLQYLAPAGAMAGALLLTVMFFGRDPAPRNQVNDTTAAALYDMELLADADAFELSQEADLEFIEWAAAMAELESAGG